MSWCIWPNGPAAGGIGFRNCFYPDVGNTWKLEHALKVGCFDSHFCSRSIYDLPHADVNKTFGLVMWDFSRLMGLIQMVTGCSWIFDYHKAERHISSIDLPSLSTQQPNIKNHNLMILDVWLLCVGTKHRKKHNNEADLTCLFDAWVYSEPSKKPMPWRRRHVLTLEDYSEHPNF